MIARVQIYWVGATGMKPVANPLCYQRCYFVNTLSLLSLRPFHPDFLDIFERSVVSPRGFPPFGGGLSNKVSRVAGAGFPL